MSRGSDPTSLPSHEQEKTAETRMSFFPFLRKARIHLLFPPFLSLTLCQLNMDGSPPPSPKIKYLPSFLISRKLLGPSFPPLHFNTTRGGGLHLLPPPFFPLFPRGREVTSPFFFLSRRAEDWADVPFVCGVQGRRGDRSPAPSSRSFTFCAKVGPSSPPANRNDRTL